MSTPGLPGCSLSPSVAAWDRGLGESRGASDSACERRGFDLRPQGREGLPGEDSDRRALLMWSSGGHEFCDHE